jgi:2-keto-4-pentenoate hydratase/ferredoxin
MKITVDPERCEGFASCVISAPDLFDLDEERSVAVVLEPRSGGDVRRQALEAAASCPVRAITVLDAPVEQPGLPPARPVTDGVSAEAVAAAADRLEQATATGIPCTPVRDVLPATLAAGYAVQQVLTARAVATGRRVIGRKVGLTNPVVQRQLRVDRPDLGVLFADMAVADRGTVDIGRLLQPRIEAEVAMVLGADLGGPDLTDDRIRAAVAEVVTALEIVDSRIAGWDISLVDTVADNASSGLFVLGGQRRSLGGLDLRAVRMTLREDGHEVSTGTGADCLGDPLAALAWLAVAARDLGQPLRAGDVVLSGALGPMVPVRPGATYTAEVSGLGPVEVTFSREAAT